MRRHVIRCTHAPHICPCYNNHITSFAARCGRLLAKRASVSCKYMEEWRDVVGYEGLYQVSSYGRVKSLHYVGGKFTRYCPHCGRGRKYPPGERILKSYVCKGIGRVYPTVRLSKDGITKNYSIHRLVAIAFLPQSPDKPDVNHKDGDKLNPRLENLEWVTTSENLRHAFKMGLLKMPPRHPRI